MPLDANNGFFAFRDGVNTLDECDGPAERRGDDAADTNPVFAVATEHHVGAQLVDGLPDNARAIQDFDRRLDFVLAISLLDGQGLAGGGRGVKADAFSAEAQENS